MSDAKSEFTQAEATEMFTMLLLIVANPPEYYPTNDKAWAAYGNIENARVLLKRIVQSNDQLKALLETAKAP